MQMFLMVLSFILIVLLGTVFDIEPFSLFIGTVFGSGFTIVSYYIEKRKESI